jgi:hypothetical protein
MSPITECGYRDALAAAGSLDGAVDDLSEFAVLEEAVRQRFAYAAPAETTSSIAGAIPRRNRSSTV